MMTSLTRWGRYSGGALKTNARVHSSRTKGVVMADEKAKRADG
jgi:hypothetical protein